MKETILEEATRIVDGQRQDDYGHPADNYADVAAIWSVVLRDQLTAPITAQRAALCMVGLKLARAAHRHHRDNLVDLAGYARVAEMIADREGPHAKAD